VTALIDRKRLAQRRESRGDRREKLLAVAREVVLEVPYGRLTLDVVGQRAGLRQGAAAIFFPSREVLALEVLELELTDWYRWLEERVSGEEGALDADGLTALLTESLESRRTLARLLGLLPTIAEQDAGPLALYRLESFRHRFMLRLGEALERRCPLLAPGAGAVLLRRLQLVVAALFAAANPATMTSVALDAPELEELRVDVGEELACLTRLMVEGSSVQPGVSGP
jgi:AcrR family transcriptional regulator